MNEVPASLAALNAVLFDLDGTIYLGERLLPGANEIVAYLRETRRRVLFLTNNSSADSRHYADKLRRLDVPATPEDILTSGEATARFLASTGTYRRLFVVGTPSFEQELEAHGLTLADDNVDAVVLGFDKTLTYSKLERAARLLRSGVPYFATNPDRVCPTEGGPIPDCGSIAALIREATGRSPQFIGKPSTTMIAMALDKIGATAHTAAMIGDRLYTDMAMAMDAGLVAILVFTGETRQEDLSKADRAPYYLFQDLLDVLEAWRADDAGRLKH